jgi:hypothetical protein
MRNLLQLDCVPLKRMTAATALTAGEETMVPVRALLCLVTLSRNECTNETN